VTVCIVCTGNVARSPAIEILLRGLRPDLTVISAAVGLKAKAGRVMAKPMRELLTGAGYGEQALAHRSQLITDVPPGAVFYAVAPVHMRRLTARGVRGWYIGPIPDPAFGGREAYGEVWPLIVAAAERLAGAL
jgi:protein-tyrosine-phosphatase